MKNLILTAVIFAISSCTGYDYHAAAVSESLISSNQNYHLRMMKKYASQTAPEPTTYRRVCTYYTAGYGGFSGGCY